MNDMQFKVVPWEEAAESNSLSSHEHICGQECLHKRLSQWLETNSRPAPATPAEPMFSGHIAEVEQPSTPLTSDELWGDSNGGKQQ